MAINKIEIETQDFDRFVKKANRLLRTTEVGRLATIRRDKDKLVLTFSGLSESRIQYLCEINETGLTASLLSEEVALLHKTMRSQVEPVLIRVMEALGARVSTD